MPADEDRLPSKSFEDVQSGLYTLVHLLARHAARELLVTPARVGRRPPSSASDGTTDAVVPGAGTSG